MNIEITRKLLEFLESDTLCATATVTKATGSIPNEVGATLIATEGGKLATGTVGGGEIERQTLEACAEALTEGRHRSFRYKLTDEEAGGIGMSCGGTATLFVHVHRPRPQLVLFGAGHVNVALAALAEPFDWAVTVVDDRPEWCSEAHFPKARRIVATLEEAVVEITFSEQASYVVIATRDHDDRGLRLLADRAVAFVGMVASRRKVISMLRTLHGEGIDLQRLIGALRSPIGLALGGRGPADVALSILAQLQAVRHGASGEALALSPAHLAGELKG
ncbi:MAG: XdhC family protein [Deltaproteobacteria bacterium]|nr:XdhC family protein [Deltaproteobacteria bacterium]